jgi:hypothetical protein
VKVLLDHCVPKPFKNELPKHEVSTAREMGWEALKNGALLDQAQSNGFDVVITVDQNVRYQQNLTGRSIPVCVLTAGGITIEKLRPLVPALEVLLPTVQPGRLYQVTA